MLWPDKERNIMSYRILIVDDEVSQFNRYAEVLQAYKELQLKHVTNGPDAIIEIQKNPPDIIFLDQVFNTGNVEIRKLYGVDINGKIGEHDEDTNPEDIKNDELKQGLYILKMIRNLEINTERKISIIFCTQYVDNSAKIWDEANKCGAQDYISKDRITKNELVSVIEEYLFIKLITTEEVIENLINIHEIKDIKEKGALVSALYRAASKRRRRKVLFIEAVLNKLPKIAPTLGKLSNAINEIEKDVMCKHEAVAPYEILQWVLTRIDYNGIPKDRKDWQYVSRNPVRYIFQAKLNNKYFLLKIVHPKYSRETVNFDTTVTQQGVFPVRLFPSFELKQDDPDWEGTHVLAYLEEAETTKTLHEYIGESYTKVPVDANRIQAILSDYANVLKKIESTGHGMIDIDSLYISETNMIESVTSINNSVWISDFPLWNCVKDDGRNKIEGLTLQDRKKRDLQSLGIVGDTLLTGHAGGIETVGRGEIFIDFLRQCATGDWNLEKEIPVPPVNARFIHCGNFASNLEKGFFYNIKKVMLERNVESFIFLNARIRLKTGIPNDVDILVVFRNKIVWIDVKGSQYYKGTEQLPKHATNLIEKLRPIYFPCEAYLVMDNNDFRKLEQSLNPAEKSCVFAFDTFIRNKLFADPETSRPASFQNFGQVYDILRNMILSTTESVYEETQEFQTTYGKVISQKREDEYDELLTDKYYIRRYCVGHITDRYLDSNDIRLLIEQAINENLIMKQLQSSNLLLPIVVMAVGADNRQVGLDIALSNSPDGASVRWLYKVYSRPNEGTECLLSIMERVNNISREEKEKLLYHYLKAADALLRIKGRFQFGIDESSLKILEIGNQYTGIIEPKFNMIIDKRSILMIIDVLNNGENKIQSYKDEIVKSTTVLETTIEMLINKLSHYNRDEGYLNKIKNDTEKIIADVKTFKSDNLNENIMEIMKIVRTIRNDVTNTKKNRQINTIENIVNKIKNDVGILKNSKPISNQPHQNQQQKNTPVGQSLNHQVEKDRAESIGIKQPVSTQKPTSSVQETTPVDQLQDPLKKNAEAESSGIKQPEKQSHGRVEGIIKLLVFSVDFNFGNGEKRREQVCCNFINNIQIGQSVKIGYPEQSSKVYSVTIWILNEQQYNTAKDVQDVNIASEPVMQYGSIMFQGKGYIFKIVDISPEDLKGLHADCKVSFIPMTNSIATAVKVIPS